MLQNNPILKNKIALLWDKFWSGGISNPLTAIEQITYLLFMKRMDDLDIKKQADANTADKEYKSKFDGDFILPGNENAPINKEALRWSSFKHLQPEDRLNFVQNKVFPFLKALNGNESSFTRHMKDAVFIIPKPSLLVDAMEIIEDIFSEIEKDSKQGGQAFQDIQGDVYEVLLSEISTAGKNGQFRTPRHIIKLITELVDPKQGEKICDPACGSAGFLLGAYQYIVTNLNKDRQTLKPDEDGFIRSLVSEFLTEDIRDELNANLYGYDIDITMVRLALMNMMMHGIDDPMIDYHDTLSKSFTEENKYDVVMANPPFTGSIDKSDINESLELSTTKTELLFIDNILRLLKNGGTAGIIVPQGVLFGSSKAHVEARRMLIEKCELKAIITMPSGIFKPYAGVSTAILIFTKGLVTENVWYYNMESDGYSLDDKREKKPEYGYGDLQDIIVKYKQRNFISDNNRERKYFFVNISEIDREKYDLSFSKYQKDVYEEVVFEEPALIFQRIKKLENEINVEISELEEILK